MNTEKEFPDISFYQGEMDFGALRARTDAVIIRAGQNTWVDEQFERNWSEARGMLRGTYWLYDDRIDPGRQADLLISLLRDDPPEMEVWADWEMSYRGPFGGIGNVVAFMERLEAAGLRVGLYTGYYWFRDNARPSEAQKNYLKGHLLWLAWYGGKEDVLVPDPFTEILLWQYGTPIRGAEYGAESKEIDMNFFVGTTEEFYQRYKQPIPIEGDETMSIAIGTVRAANLNVRSTPDSSSPANINGASFLHTNDLVLYDRTSNGFAHLTKVRREGKDLSLPGAECWAFLGSASSYIRPEWLIDIAPNEAAEAVVALDLNQVSVDGQAYIPSGLNGTVVSFKKAG